MYLQALICCNLTNEGIQRWLPAACLPTDVIPTITYISLILTSYFTLSLSIQLLHIHYSYSYNYNFVNLK